jgi:hypothetical protein
MPKYKVRLELSRDNVDGPVNAIEETISSEYETRPDWENRLGRELAAEFQKAIRFHEYLSEVPDVDVDLVDAQPINFAHPKQFFSAGNTQGLWLEIHNTLADVRFLLARARAYKSVEPSGSGTDDMKALRYYAHFSKMHNLNLAVLGMVKIQDLVVRLLFENFGGDLIKVDQAEDDWEADLTMQKARRGLKERLDSGNLEQSEYDQIKRALDVPSTSTHQATVVAYRNGIVHRLRPSVDYPSLFTPLEDRVGQPIFDASGKQTGRKYSMWGLPTKPEYCFADLYSPLLDYLKHVIEMLTLLKAIPRLA